MYLHRFPEIKPGFLNISQFCHSRVDMRLLHGRYSLLRAVLTGSHFSASLSPLEHTEDTIPEEYIVVFKKEANEVQSKLTSIVTVCYFTTSQSVQEHMDSLNDMLTALSNSSYSIKRKYHIGSFRGYCARMDDQ